MNASNQEIITAYELNGMSPEDIAFEFEYEVSAVKSILLQSSAAYRKASKKDDTLDFTDEEFEDCKKVIMNYAKYGEENPNLQVKCALFVCQDKKGHFDPRKLMPTLNVNVLDFNSQMQKALMAQQRTMKQLQVTSNNATVLNEDEKKEEQIAA